jgi:hypothetical protein
MPRSLIPPHWAIWLALASLLPAQEVQRHGVDFEEWVRAEFFDGYTAPNYTDKWDIPAAAKLRHGGVPVNPKAIKYGTPIGLGDALRQFDIDEPFLLIIGYWEQRGPRKHFVKIVPTRVEPAQWRALWGEVTREDLERYDAVIKDRSLDYREARRQAQALKRQPPFTTTTIVLNPKIDSRGQRRLQCSLRFRDFFRLLAPNFDPTPEEAPELWGVPFPGALASDPRSFERDGE